MSRVPMERSGLRRRREWRLRMVFANVCLALCVVILVGCSSAHAEEAVPTPTPVPLANPVPGATLESGTQAAGGGAIERTLFDLYLSDKFIGGSLASYNDLFCEIEDPLGTIEQIPDFQKERTEEVVPLLAGRIEKERTVGGIGKVKCDIYTFRVVIELEPQFLKAQARALSGRIADPEGGVSLQQNVGVAAAGEFDGDTNSSFTHRSVIGAGRFFGRFNGAAVEGEAYELTEASSFGYLGDYEVGAGFLETTGQSFASSLQYTGLQVRTTDKLLLNREDGRGTPFEIFVPSRARVEFYRSGRLISVQSLDFGLQEIDTRTFPQGSYDVDVVITETNGRVTQDRKFFTKSGFLSIRGRPTYDLQGGVLRDEFSTEDTPIYYTGVQWRATDILDLSISMYGTDELSIGQATVTGLYREFYFVGGSSVSSDGDLGFNSTFSWRVFDSSLNGGFAKSVAVSESSRELAATPTPSPDDTPDFIPQRDRVRDLYFQDRESYTANIRRTVGKVEFGYVFQSDKFEGDDLRRSYGPILQWSIFDGQQDSLRFSASYYDTESDTVLSNAFSYRRRLSADWSLGAQLAYYDRDDSNEVVGFLSASYQGRRRPTYSSRFSITSEARNKRGSDEEGSVYSNQLNADYGGDYLFGRAFVREQGGSASGKGSFGVMAESAVLVGDSGATAISYPMAQDAVFIADIKGVSPGTRFQILLNDQVYDTVEAGRRSAVSVPPFKTYRVAIRPEDASQLVDYESKVYNVTFFPGNVVERSWSVSQVMIVLGRVVDEAGRPIPLQRIRGPREFTATDEGGMFQAEIEGGETLSIESPTVHCTLEIGQFERPEYFLDLGDVVCRGGSIEHQ